MIKIYYRNPQAPKPNQPLIPSIHGVIINNSHEILLHKREDSPIWAIPGGKIELDESIEQCLKREMQEELGVKVSTERLLGVYTDPSYILALGDTVQRVFLIVFLCTIANGELKLTNETMEYRWFTKKDLSTVETFPLVKEIIDQVFDDTKTVFFD
ncbi:MAG: NUDIX domain-containing protein [Candidatus Moraniibacteriota bacterium]